MQRILVIDDEDEIKDATIDILKSKGFITKGASSGHIGLQLAKKFHPDLILCDIDMPELNGYDVLKTLRQNPEFEDIPFIFLSATSSMKNLRKGMNLGADDYLTKPLQIDDLLAAISIRLKRHETHIHNTITEQQLPSKTDKHVSEQLKLTPRQKHILGLVNQGKLTSEIAKELSVRLDVATILQDIAIKLNNRFSQENQQEHLSATASPHADPNSTHSDNLTPRQREVLALVANGMTTKKIAETLFISVKTVETHRGQLMERLNIHDLAGLVRYAIRVGLINLDEK